MRHTTTEFTGFLSMMDTSSSWVSRWQKQNRFKPGIYALAVKQKANDENEMDEEMLG